METNKSSLEPGDIPRLILLVLASLMTMDAIWRASSTMLKVSNILILLSIVSACTYFSFGAKKNAAPYFKGFMIMFAISEFVRITLVQESGEVASNLFDGVAGDIVPVGSLGPAIPLMADTIIFAVLCVYAFATDLGRRKSMILTYVVIVISLLLFIIGCVHIFTAGGNVMMMLTTTGTRLVLCLALQTMVLSKYKDKAARNTK